MLHYQINTEQGTVLEWDSSTGICTMIPYKPFKEDDRDAFIRCNRNMQQTAVIWNVNNSKSGYDPSKIKWLKANRA